MHLLSKNILKWTKPGLITVLLACVSMNFYSCGSSSNSTTTILGSWSLESSVDAGARSGAVLFTIGDKFYICSGFNGNNNSKNFLKDLWVYDSSIDTWRKKTNFPGVGRSGAVAFAANGKGYVGLGYDGTNYLNDFWSYDPTTDSWTKVADFAGAARRNAVGFAINNMGYVGTGSDDNLYYKDFYQYNPIGDKWDQKPSVPKIERAGAFSFVIDGIAYVGGGLNPSGSVNPEFYAYDPQGGDGTGLWIAKNDLQDDNIDNDPNDKGYTIARNLAVTFVIDGKGYVVTGARNNENWEYTPGTDTWIKKRDFGVNFNGTKQLASVRSGAVGFAINNLGYVCTGNSSSSYLNDKWQYNPTQVSNQ